MKSKSIIAIFSLFLSFSISAQQWKIADNHSIAFSSKDASGVFKEIYGTIQFDAADLGNSKLNLKIKVESINTGNGLQNKHAKGEEWFNAEKYPEIEFVSTKIIKTEDGYKATGKLEIRGITKEVNIPFTFSKKGTKGTMVGKFSVNRKDFGIGKSENTVAETIKITATLPLIKK